ncbi:MAG: polysaccharide biosynthesis protein [Mogibacterium sp.]|nr:polysaccharide biosynthesis protein [Mogibacterium sp.]
MENNNTQQPNTSHKAASRLMQGATILAIAGILSKVFGAIFRIPLTNMIGAEGQSYYGAAYPVYQFFYVIATAGFPVAISRMVSERIALGDYINANKSFKLALKVSLVISVISFIICFFGAKGIATFYGNPGAENSIRAISIALLFTPIAASLRGYFQGHQNMTPTAVSQVVEQIVRVTIGLILAYIFFRTSLENAAAGATFGASAGMIAAMILLLSIYKKNLATRQENMRKSVVRDESDNARIKELIEIVIPITIGSSIMPLMMIIDAAVIMRRLQATGWTLAMSKTLYGLISGYCDPLVNLPVVFIDAITISLIPAVTTAFTLKKKADLDGNIKTGLKTMMVITYPCAIGLIVLAKPILHLLFPTKLDEADLAIHTLQILAFSIIALAIMRTMSSSLQGIGKMTLPVINLFIGAVVKIIVTFILVGIPALNINGAAFGTVCAYLTAAILNYRGLRKHANVELDLKDIFLRPLLASVIMGVSAIVFYEIMYLIHPGNTLATGFAILGAIVVYFVMVFVTKAVSREELALVPKGDKIYEIAVRLHLAK